MGLLDNLLGSDTSSGLLSFLRDNAMNQQAPVGPASDTAQYAPQSGPIFPSAPNPPITPINSPSPLDSAQWPAGPVGAPSQANAQMVPQQPPPVIPAAQSASTGPSALSRFSAGMQSIGNGGGIISALTGNYNDPKTVALQQQAQVANVTARALIAHGVPADTAMAAVQPGNSAVLSDLFKQMGTQGSHTQETDKDGNIYDVNKQTGQKTLTLAAKDDKFTNVTVKNPDGSETVRPFNTKTGGYGPPAAPAPGAGAGKYGVDPELTGPARLEALRKADPNYARHIESLVKGDTPLPTGVAALKPDAKREIEDVLAVDGSVSASDFNTRATTRKDYASGPSSRITKSLNTTIQHGADLEKSIDELGNHTWFPGMSNYLHDAYAGNTDPKYQTARANFEVAKEAFSKELDFVLSGGHSSVTGSAEIRANFDRAKSPEELHAAVQSALHKLSARLDSHATGFNQGTKSQRDGQDFLYPKNRATYNKLLGTQDTSTGQSVPLPDDASASSVTPAAPLQPGASTTINGVTIKRVN